MAKENAYDRLKVLTRTLYDYQAIRISLYNRIVSKEYLAEVKKELEKNSGKKAKKTKDEKAEEAKLRKMMIDKMIQWYMDHHTIIDLHPRLSSQMKALEEETARTNGPITDFAKYNLIKDYILMADREDDIKKIQAYELKNIPIYNEFLANVPGCGPMMSSIIISTIDIHKTVHVSSIWRYAGIDVWTNPDTGEQVARNNHSEQLIDREYISKDGKVETKKSTTYNPAFRTKMLGVLGDSFVKHKGKYRDIYDQGRVKYSMREGWKPARIHRAAIRYTIKEFLRDLWNKWRELEGYPPELDWYETQRQRAHGVSAEPVNSVRTTANGDIIPDDITLF